MKVGDRIKAKDPKSWLGDEVWIVVRDWGDDHWWVKSELRGTITNAFEDEVEPCTS